MIRHITKISPSSATWFKVIIWMVDIKTINDPESHLLIVQPATFDGAILQILLIHKTLYFWWCPPACHVFKCNIAIRSSQTMATHLCHHYWCNMQLFSQSSTFVQPFLLSQRSFHRKEIMYLRGLRLLHKGPGGANHDKRVV